MSKEKNASVLTSPLTKKLRGLDLELDDPCVGHDRIYGKFLIISEKENE